MSLDVSIYAPQCEHCGSERREVYEWNYTYNVSPMIGAATVAAGLAPQKRMLDGIEGRAGDYAPKLRAIIAALEEDPARYIAMNPPNGWGSYETLVPRLRKLLDALERYPGGEVTTWR